MATLEKIRSKGSLLVGAVGFALLAFIVGDFLNSGSSYFNKSREVLLKLLQIILNTICFQSKMNMERVNQMIK
jgi:peptidyl-prolyl cis-trans isomerase D